MFATAEYEAYAAAQREADRLYRLEVEDPETWAELALRADELYDHYEYAAGIRSLEID